MDYLVATVLAAIVGLVVGSTAYDLRKTLGRARPLRAVIEGALVGGAVLLAFLFL